MNLDELFVRTGNIKVFFTLQRRNPAKNFTGKPYAGKPHVRFDEGVGKENFLPRSTLL